MNTDESVCWGEWRGRTQFQFGTRECHCQEVTVKKYYWY